MTAIPLGTLTSGESLHRGLLALAGEVKDIPGLEDADPATLRGIVRLYHDESCQRRHGGEPCPPGDFEDRTWTTFRVLWPTAGKASETYLAQLWGLAGREVAQWAAGLPYHPESRLARVAALCRLLGGKQPPGQPFLLAERSLARRMGAESKNPARDALKALEADGVIRCTERGHFGRASRYVLCQPIPPVAPAAPPAGAVAYEPIPEDVF